MAMGDTAVFTELQHKLVYMAPKKKTNLHSVNNILDLSPKYNPYVSICEQIKMFKFSVTEFNRL